ncbi:MAG: SDR family oxidoreductase [Deltaproteobacteria bacterium]|nr:SDR family oxidoreductase [Deltaproteobacteria bacterium]
MIRNANGVPDSDSAPVALVTGGAVRVGRALCLALGRDGFRVAIHYHSSERAAADLAGELGRSGADAGVLKSDLTRPGAAVKLVEDTIARFDRLELLINNAALFFDDHASMNELARMKVLNFDAAAALIDAAAPELVRSRGSVITIADVAAYQTLSKHKAYSRTKAALLDLTHRKALALATLGVRVNAVCPGTVLFPESYGESRRKRIVDQIPLGRAGTPKDVAQAVVYLARADFVTGQVIAVDGGRILRAIDNGPPTLTDPHLN